MLIQAPPLPFLRGIAVAALLALMLGVAACGDSDDEAQDAAGATATSESSSDSSNAGGGSQGGGSGGGSNTGPSFSGDVEQARAGAVAVDDVYEDFGAAVEAGVATADVPARDTLEKAEGNESLTKVCDLMSKEAQKQSIVYVKRSSGIADVEWTCEKATALLLRRSGQNGGLEKSLRAEVVGVNAEGDRATASIRFGGKGPISTVGLVKEDGRWKLAATPSASDQKSE